MYVLFIFFGSIIIFLLVYFRLSPDQKIFFLISGETHICFVINYIITERVPISLSSYFKHIFFSSLLLLIILGYHFILNKRNFNDFHIKDILPDRTLLLGGAFCIFSLFALLNRKIFMKLTVSHLPTYEELVLMFLVVVTEEIISRYYIQGISLKAFNPVYSIAFSSILFSLLHFFSRQFELKLFFCYMLCGIIYGFTYHKSKNLSIPLFLHFFNNILPTFFH